MNRYIALPLFALAVFSVAAIAGRMILTLNATSATPFAADARSVKADSSRHSYKPQTAGLPEESGGNEGVFQSAGVPFPETPLAEVPHDARDASSVIEVVSHDDAEHPPPFSFASSTTSIPQAVAATQADTRAAIMKRYPDLDQNVLQGWVDTYHGLPLNELEALLAEKFLMADMLAGSSFLQQTSMSLDVDKGSTTHDEGFRDAVRCIQSNLRNALSPGFRRTIVRTMPAIISSQRDGGLKVVTEFDLRPGQIRPSSNPLHIAIEDNGSHWFSLNQGSLLTRYGAFTVLTNGQLGLVSGDGTEFAVDGCEIPPNATDVMIATDGSVSVMTAQQQQPAGQIRLVQMADSTDLQSQNGVFFGLSPGRKPSEPGAFKLRSGHLEQSNADLEQERVLLQHVQSLLQK